MPEATLTSKGQITLPLEVRRSLGLTAGSRVRFVRTDDGSFELVPATGTVTALRGVVTPPAEAVSLEQMDQAVAEASAGRTSG